MLEDVVVALSSGDIEATLDNSKVTTGGVVKVAVYVPNCLILSAMRLDFGLSNSC